MILWPSGMGIQSAMNQTIGFRVYPENDHQHDQPSIHGILKPALQPRGGGFRGGPSQKDHQQCGTNGPQSRRHPQVWSPSWLRLGWPWTAIRRAMIKQWMNTGYIRPIVIHVVTLYNFEA